ncbi:glycoside hydrolase family 92 protein [Kineococcus sp. R8]|uniref:GH92 family glycosyl hydrolase n=1 Tax=Kineococcus siccus TaxID=2696567 RepID=UPI001411E556|nr:GH92 family glycosyl hydrolase [Kineococcus siccus]NAZ82728.1 glycoside hydrolase family 92 protein [Kineococcus siccus]
MPRSRSTPGRQGPGGRAAPRAAGWSAAICVVLAAALGAPATAVPASAVGVPAPATASPRPVDLVDPLIGSAGGGNTYPGAVRPFGMLAWSPTTTAGDQTGTGGSNGYSFDTPRVRGFSLTHVNGAGCFPGAAGDVPIMPFTGPVTSSPSADVTDAVFAAGFRHDDELADPGHYRVGLDNGVTTDLAVTDRAGVGEFTFPAGEQANLLFRTSNSLNGSEDAETRIDPATGTVTGSVLTGAFCGRRANGGENNRNSYYRLHFTASFDAPVVGTGTWQDGRLHPGATTVSGGEGYLTGADRAGRGSGGYVTFDTSASTTVRMRVAISYVDLVGAEQNLAAELPAGAGVADVAEQGARAWDERLRRVSTEGGTPDERVAFTTALYHSLLQPNLVSDVDGRYPGMDGAVQRLEEFQGAQYGNFSGWDQYRAHLQLLALLEPEVAGDFAQSLLNYSRQNDDVWDRWVHVNGATHVMNGDPSAVALATFYAFGVRNFDVHAAFESLVAQAEQPRPEGLSDAGCPGQCEGQRPNLAQYLASGYAAQDACHCWGGAAETLEMSVADAALAGWARQLGRDDVAARFAPRAGWWRNVYDPQATPEAGYVRPRLLDGSWLPGFDPASEVGFAQGTSATYTWMVPQDPQGLAAAMGGRDVAAQRLDGFFRAEDGSWSFTAGDPLRYDATNQPGLHAPFLYNAFGQPWKTQDTVRAIVDEAYGTGPRGLPGNDDLGTMSAWYVWAAMGLFPQDPTGADLVVSSPVFDRVTLDREGARDLVVLAPGASSEYRFVQSATLDGSDLTRSWVPGSWVVGGGTIEHRLGATPNTTWATAPADLPGRS